MIFFYYFPYGLLYLLPLPSCNFRSHPVGGATSCYPFSPLYTQLSTESKVSKLDWPRPTEEDVVALDVSVDDVVFVEVLQTLQALPANCCHLWFFQNNSVHHSCQISTIQKLTQIMMPCNVLYRQKKLWSHISKINY